MTTKLCLSIFVLAFAISSGNAFLKAPIGSLKSLSITDCDSKIKQESNLYAVDESGTKALDVVIDLPDGVDIQFSTFSLDVAKWEGNNWMENVYNADGPLCEYIKRYVPKIWKKIRDIVQPPLDFECSTKPGKYTIKGLQAASTDLDLPAILYGRFKLTFKVFIPNSEDVLLCKIYQTEISL